MPEKPPKRPGALEPQDPESAVYRYIFAAFQHFAPQGQAIDEESLIRLCIAGRCPNREISLGVIRRMVEKKLLTLQTDPKTKQRSYHIPRGDA